MSDLASQIKAKKDAQAEPVMKSVYPPSSTKTERPSNNIDTSKLAAQTPKKQGLFKAIRCNYIIKADGSKVMPNREGIFETQDKEVLEILEYFATHRYGLVEKI
jgi:hypothetical protein